MGHLAAIRIQQVARQRWGRPQPAFDSAEFWGSNAPIALPRLLSVGNTGALVGKSLNGKGKGRVSGTNDSHRQGHPPGSPHPNATGSSVRCAQPMQSAEDNRPTAREYADLCSRIDAMRADFAKLEQAL